MTEINEYCLAACVVVLTTTDDNGAEVSKILARFETEDRLYVSAHHWTRGWYHLAVANPEVAVEIGGVETQRIAVPIEGEEFEKIASASRLPLMARFLMGFPPSRDILRLDLVTQ